MLLPAQPFFCTSHRQGKNSHQQSYFLSHGISSSSPFSLMSYYFYIKSTCQWHHVWCCFGFLTTIKTTSNKPLQWTRTRRNGWNGNDNKVDRSLETGDSTERGERGGGGAWATDLAADWCCGSMDSTLPEESSCIGTCIRKSINCGSTCHSNGFSKQLETWVHFDGPSNAGDDGNITSSCSNFLFLHLHRPLKRLGHRRHRSIHGRRVLTERRRTTCHTDR